MKKTIAIIVAVLVALVASVEGWAQFSKLRFGDYGVESISPESFSAVKGAVWLEVTNPMEGFTVSEIRGMVYKDGVPFITGSAADFRVSSGTGKVVISGRAALCVKSKFSTNNFKKIRIPQFSETRFGSFVGLFSLFLCL